MQSSFEDASGFSRYHPSKGYYWDFKSQRIGADKAKPKEEKPREEPSSLFQRKRVDMLLGELIKKFPLPTPAVQPKNTPVPVKTEPEQNNTQQQQQQQGQQQQQQQGQQQQQQDQNKDVKNEIKQEKIKPPPEKKPRLN